MIPSCQKTEPPASCRHHPHSLFSLLNETHEVRVFESHTLLAGFVEHYNHKRVHKSLDNLTPADVYNGRSRAILDARELLTEQTLRRRRLYNLGKKPRKEELIRPAVIRECLS